jgi:hypothetical protein
MSQLGLFEELPEAPAKAWKATLVRSHYRRTVGDAASPESKPESPMIGTQSRRTRESGTKSRPKAQSGSTGQNLGTAEPILPPPPYPAPHNHTKTSTAAAEGLGEGRKLTQAERCFQAILASMNQTTVGLTREQVAAATGIEESTVCARVRPMVTGQDSRYQIVEPGITRIGAEGARQKVLWVAIESNEPRECTCKDCGGKALSRMFEVAMPGHFNKSEAVFQGYLIVKSCTVSGCWWSEVSK